MMGTQVVAGSEHAKQWGRAFRMMAAVILCALVIWSMALSVLAKANFWYTEEGVLKELRLKVPTVVSIEMTERNVLRRSVITVRYSNGDTGNWYLDTDVLFNYVFYDTLYKK